MKRQDYRKAAELALDQAKGRALNSSSEADTNYVQSLTGIARVYAMLAAIPDEQDVTDSPRTTYRITP